MKLMGCHTLHKRGDTRRASQQSLISIISRLDNGHSPAEPDVTPNRHFLSGRSVRRACMVVPVLLYESPEGPGLWKGVYGRTCSSVRESRGPWSVEGCVWSYLFFCTRVQRALVCGRVCMAVPVLLYESPEGLRLHFEATHPPNTPRVDEVREEGEDHSHRQQRLSHRGRERRRTRV
jgi:hypothetical protein